MGDHLMELLRPRIEKEIQEAVQAAVQDITMQNLFIYVQEGGLPVDYASKRANQTPEAFIANMREAGYRVPEASA